MNAQQIDATLYQAATCQQAGQIKQAVDLYLNVIKVEPRNPFANHNLGVLAMLTGKGLQVALPLFQTAWQADPAHPQHWQSFVRALVQGGAVDAARQVHADGTRRGLRGPDVDLLLSRLAAPAAPAGPAPAASAAGLENQRRTLERLLSERQFPQALALARTLLASTPGLAWAWLGLARALRATQQLRAALEAQEQAARLQPDQAQVQLDLAELALQLGLLADAEAAYARTLQLDPTNGAAQRGAIDCLLRTNRYSEAITAAESALAANPAATDLHLLLGDAQFGVQQLDAAQRSYRRAWELQRGAVGIYQKLGTVLHAQGDEPGMLELANAMLQAKPGYAEAHADIGRIMLGAGRVPEATAAFAQAVRLRPDDLVARASWLGCCNYLPQLPAAELLQEMRRYGTELARPAKPFNQWNCTKQPARLRVGLVSGDLREHPVSYFLQGVLEHSRRERIEWFVYSTSPERDAMTARLEPCVHSWKSLVGLDPGAAARLIHADAVHVLVDLAGHTELTGLPVFTWRPAPVQVSWLGYFATTGLAEIDYLIADPAGVPEAERGHFCEQIHYLPDTRLCFTPPESAPPVAPAPLLERGFLTFGCFQALSKINDGVLAAWSRVLAACPTARLRIQNAALHREWPRAHLCRRLQEHGIDLARVDLHGAEQREQYFRRHAEVDVLLDTFPYPGGTTTCEALWMGVPTITLNGSNLLARQGASLLGAAGLGDWIAQSVDEYVELARHWCGAGADLATLRSDLRSRLGASALLDAPRFAQHLETALWQLWEQRRRG